MLGGFNLGGTNATGQVPNMPGNWGLIDRETPMEFRTKPDYVNGKTWELVFSDEFNTDNRSFYPGGGFSFTRIGKPAVDFTHR